VARTAKRLSMVWRTLAPGNS